MVDLQPLLSLLPFILYPMNLFASIDVNMDVKEKKIPQFSFLDLFTHWHPQILLTFTWLFRFYHSLQNYEKIPKWKENYREYTYILRHLTKYSRWTQKLSSVSVNLQLYFEIILAIGLFVISPHLWFLCATIIQEQSASKTEKKMNHGNVLSQKRGNAAVYPRNLRV